MLRPNRMWPSLGNLSPSAKKALKWVRENRADRHTAQELADPMLTDWRNEENITVEVEVRAPAKGGQYWEYDINVANNAVTLIKEVLLP